MKKLSREGAIQGRVLFLISLALALGGCGSGEQSVGSVDSASSAQDLRQRERKFDFHVGDAFLASLNPEFSPTVARAANRDTITVAGKGKFDVREGEAEGRGTFEHRSATGALVATGTWKAKRLISFRDFGGESDLPPDFRGGSAVLRLEAVGHPAEHPRQRIEFEATLTVDCAIGAFPSGFEEGINFDTPSIRFDEKVRGATVFVVRH